MTPDFFLARAVFRIRRIRDLCLHERYLFNFKPTTIFVEDYNANFSGLNLYFVQRDGGMFRATFVRSCVWLPKRCIWGLSSRCARKQ